MQEKGGLMVEPALLRAVDQNKDQTYFLSQLTEAQLEKAIFPIGDLTKDEVRDLANKHNLVVANKKRFHRNLFYWRTSL